MALSLPEIKRHLDELYGSDYFVTIVARKPSTGFEQVISGDPDLSAVVNAIRLSSQERVRDDS